MDGQNNVQFKLVFRVLIAGLGATLLTAAILIFPPRSLATHTNLCAFAWSWYSGNQSRTLKIQSVHGSSWESNKDYTAIRKRPDGSVSYSNNVDVPSGDSVLLITHNPIDVDRRTLIENRTGSVANYTISQYSESGTCDPIG